MVYRLSTIQIFDKICVLSGGHYNNIWKPIHLLLDEVPLIDDKNESLNWVDKDERVIIPRRAENQMGKRFKN